MKRINQALAGSALVGLIALAAIGPASSGAAQLPSCTPTTDISAIIDDSGSMSGTDPSKLRSSLVEFIAGSPLMQGKKMSAIEFGSNGFDSNFNELPGSGAIVLVPPTALGDAGAQATFTGALGDSSVPGSGAINANGPAGGSAGTDYDTAFTLSNTSNPGANSRLFLSDGEPNGGTYNPAGPSVNPSVKTFVVGLTVASSTALNQIASSTGGPAVFPANSAVDLGPVTGDVIAAMNCKTAPPRIVDNFLRPNQQKVHAFKATGKVADILTTWSTPGTQITSAPSVRVLGGSTATAAKKGKVKARVQKGATFSGLHLTGLKKGQKVKFTVKAKKLVGATTATSQVVQ